MTGKAPTDYQDTSGETVMGLNFRKDFSLTEQRILNVLIDGLDHKRCELLAVLPDPQFASPGNLSCHLKNIRKKLKTVKQDVVCVNKHMSVHYRWVRLLGYVEEW